MKIVTFNIRCDHNQDGKNSFNYRKDLITQKIAKENPDIICFQEVLPHVAIWLKETLEAYYIIGCGRDENLEDEQTAIAFKKTKYQLIAMNTFWLSPEPHRPASRYQSQSSCPRTCTQVLLQDVTSKKILRILNTHFDHEGSQARVLAAEQIVKYIEDAELFKDAPIILAGDLNALPDDTEIKLLTQEGELVDLTRDLEGTFHDYGQLVANEKIDYIMASKGVKAIKKELWKEEQEGVFLSDHYPISITLDI